MNQSVNSKRIAKNTLMLYIRMLFLMFINLYTTRVILKALGIEDYGIYTAVASFVSMFGMISTSLAGAISRYLTFSLAKDTSERLRDVFSTSIIIQLVLCCILLVIAETIGIWFVNSKMVIPNSRLIAANWVFQISILTTIINLVSIPYNSLLIAYEKMSAFAYIGIYEGFAKLLIAFIIPYSQVDSLILYSILLCVISLSTRILYGIYCSKHFPECKFKYTFDKQLIKEMFGFAGWNFIGTSSGVLRNQGINILINVFCGSVANAAYGIAMQVNSAVSNFSGNFTTAVRPQITKLYAVGDKAGYENLVIKSTKFSFYILMIMCLPLITEAYYIVGKWLVEVPQYTIHFIYVVLILTMVDSYSIYLIILLLATSELKRYQILVGTIQLLNFPLAYILLKLGFSPVLALSSIIFISIICLCARLYLLMTMLQFPVVKFFKNVILKTSIIFLLCFTIIISTKHFINPEGMIGFIIRIIIAEIVCISFIFLFGLTKSERKFISLLRK